MGGIVRISAIRGPLGAALLPAKASSAASDGGGTMSLTGQIGH